MVLLSPGGDATVMNVDLATQKGEWKPHNKPPLLSSYMFPRSSATFLPVHPVAPLGTLVLFFSSRGVTHVCVLLIHEDEVTTALDEPVPVDGVSKLFFFCFGDGLTPFQTVIEAACSSSGYINCLRESHSSLVNL